MISRFLILANPMAVSARMRVGNLRTKIELSEER